MTSILTSPWQYKADLQGLLLSLLPTASLLTLPTLSILFLALPLLTLLALAR